LVFDKEFSDDTRLGDALNGELLRRYGFRLYLLRQSWNKKIFFSRLAFDINNASPQGKDFLSNYVKLEFQTVHILSSHARWEYGWGLGYGYQWGTPLVLPILYFKGFATPRQRVTLFLPKEIKYEFLWNPKTIASATTKVSGASYSLESSDPLEYERREIRQSEFRAFVSLDREIVDWLWFSAYGGLLHNFKLDVVEPVHFKKDRTVLSAGAFNAPYIGLKIYAVIPRKWVEKAAQ
jgi:hypothetical protein